MLNNPNFKGVKFDPFLKEAGNNSFTMSPSRWIEETGATGLMLNQIAISQMTVLESIGENKLLK